MNVLEQCRKELEIFKLELDILMSAGLHPWPATAILPLTMNNVFIEPGQPDAQVSVQQTSSVSNTVPAPQVHAAPMSSAVLDPIPVPEEVTVPTNVTEIYDQILKDIADDKDVLCTLRTVWCKCSTTGKLVDFVKENVNIAMALVKSENAMKLSTKSAGGKDYVGFSKLSHEKPNLYAFLSRRAEYDDEEVLACEQYLLGFIATEKSLSEQSMTV